MPWKPQTFVQKQQKRDAHGHSSIFQDLTAEGSYCLGVIGPTYPTIGPTGLGGAKPNTILASFKESFQVSPGDSNLASTPTAFFHATIFMT